MEVDLEDLIIEKDDIDIDDLEEENIYVEETENIEEVLVDKMPYNKWSAEVDRQIGLLTNYTETIETIGFENEFWDWWREGGNPEEIALSSTLVYLGLV